MDHFELVSEYAPTGDQPQAIEKLVKGFKEGNQAQTLLGVTGSGKTFTMANVIQQLNKPTLVIAHNKTLAAQLYGEFKEFFPENAVEYFVSYYDYYQPEAYVPSTDTYIAKDSSINDEIDKLRLSATAALIERRDVIIVSSVSCIYGLGEPENFEKMMVSLRPGMEKDRDEVLRQLVDIQYDRNDMDFKRGTFRVRGDVIEIIPANEAETAVRVEFFGDEIDRITRVDVLTGEIKEELNHVAIFPASHYVVPAEQIKRAAAAIEEELEERVRYFKSEDKLLEAQRIAERTNFDIEMLKETGFCSGIENYSRHLAGQAPGTPPNTLMDYFPDDFLIIIDESHKTVPQIRGMFAGDQSRKRTLVDYGFRLPSALDNRPLNFDEFESKIDQILFVSATPGEYEAGSDRRPGGRGEQRDGGRPQDPDHHPDQADGGGSDGLHAGAGHPGQIPPLGYRYPGADPDYPGYAPGCVRRAGGHQPAPGGPGYPGGDAGGDSGRGQGRVPAFRGVADPDHRPRGPELRRPRHHVRGHHHGFHAAGHR